MMLLRHLFMRVTRSSWVSLAFLLFVYTTVAAAAFDGFYQKWGLRDGQQRYSFVDMIEGTAHRPFVYRQLVPQAANFFDEVLPGSIKDWIVDRAQQRWWWEETNLLSRLRIDPVAERDYVVRYLFVYFSSFVSLLLALFVMRGICAEMGFGDVAATLAPAVIGLSLVYFLSMGGFFYDFPEILFFGLALLFGLRNQWILLLPVTALATYNKEAFLFFVPALWPVLRLHHSSRRAGQLVLLLVAVSGLTYLAGRLPYGDNPGAVAETWFLDSVRFYVDPRNLLAFEANYGVITPRGYSVFSFALLAALLARGWSGLSSVARQHGLLVAAINFPLVLVFCGPGEMRNFSLCYMALLLVIAQNIQTWVMRTATGLTVQPLSASSRHNGSGAVRATDAP